MALQFTALTVAAGGTTGAYGWALFKVTVALVVICVLAYLLVRAAQGKVGRLGGAGGGQLRVLDRYPLSPRQALWLVEVGGRVFLLGAGEGGISRLAELDPEELPVIDGEPAGGGPAFAAILDRLRKGGGR